MLKYKAGGLSLTTPGKKLGHFRHVGSWQNSNLLGVVGLETPSKSIEEHEKTSKGSYREYQILKIFQTPETEFHSKSGRDKANRPSPIKNVTFSKNAPISQPFFSHVSLPKWLKGRVLWEIPFHHGVFILIFVRSPHPFCKIRCFPLFGSCWILLRHFTSKLSAKSELELLDLHAHECMGISHVWILGIGLL